ncbi:glycosyltransferase family 4 protein [Priestia endophytica]|uniref:Uncharacterized protein n=1 Tax=Priestia endophytica TaxID=135735 RepID=A0AAX1QG68_9BACI|nr:glycosyltransferase family 4 protein [Priestia endophytica]RAS82295.1 hypothetical protein A3864_01955 [Priestia endophytica]
MKKILYVTTISNTLNAFLIPHINQLQREGYTVDCACSVVHRIKKELINDKTHIFNIPFARNPLSLGNVKALKQLIKIQQQNSYDIIHVHTPIAATFGRLLKVRFPRLKVVYTVHGFHFYKGASFLNWGIYYPIEKVMARFTDVAVTMNSEDYKTAKKIGIKEVLNVNGVGIDLENYQFKLTKNEKILNSLGLKEEDFILLMIAEVNKNKNHKQMIDSVYRLKEKGIDIKVICAGEGPELENVKEYIKTKDLDKNIKMLGFRTDIKDLISICDIGLLMSYREGLPRNIMELMACSKPVIATDVRGNRDLINEGKNGYLVPLGDDFETANKIEKVFNDRKLLKDLGENALSSIQPYDINKVLLHLKDIY